MRVIIYENTTTIDSPTIFVTVQKLSKTIKTDKIYQLTLILVMSLLSNAFHMNLLNILSSLEMRIPSSPSD